MFTREGADLRGANLSGAGLYNTDLKAVKTDENTKMSRNNR
ncbi:MAG: pentapeptide repeat-containing protein [Microcoleaceae cyanobacterium MO_207.B10]|nr:pentapeptide repeat-containing protein [Microcoleaceae cyanobacterium MO_207.B10]